MSNLYSNLRLLAPDGEVLSGVPSQRAKWYVKKGLAKQINEDTYQLNFEPSGRAKLSAWYLIEHKNLCVVCGCEDIELLEKHHIVPSCFRRHLPDRFKSHRCFDLAPLCIQCHDDYEDSASDLKDQIIAEAGLAMYDTTDECRRKQDAIMAIKSMASGKPSMNEKWQDKCLSRIMAELGSEQYGPEDLLRLENELCEAQDEVFRKATNFHQPFEQFIIRWRKHFVEYGKPRFLDPSWIKDIEVVK